jgi:hypothetical protein
VSTKITDPSREALAAAIKAASKAGDVAAEAEQALERARDLLQQNEAKRETALAGVASARDADAAELAKGVKSRTGTAGGGATKKARQKVAELDDEIEISRAAVAQLEGELSESANHTAWALNAVLAARNFLLADLAAEVIERGRAARLTANVAENVLVELLHGHDKGPDFSDTLDKLSAADQRDAPLKLIQKEAEYFRAAGVGDGERAAINQATAAVRAFIAALETDPNAKMPDSGVTV